MLGPVSGWRRGRLRRPITIAALLASSLAARAGSIPEPAKVPVEGAQHPVFLAMPAGSTVEVNARFGQAVEGKGAGKVVAALDASLSRWRKERALAERAVQVEAAGEGLRIVVPAEGAMKDALDSLVAALGEEGRELRELFLIPRGPGKDGEEGEVLPDPRHEKGERIDAPADWWRASFAAEGPFPLSEDPHLFSVAALDDGALPEVRGMPLHLEGIRIVYGNGSVEMRDYDPRTEEIADRLTHALAHLFPGKPPELIGPRGRRGAIIHIENPPGRQGYSFAVARDDSLVVRYPGAFRYREYELMRAIAEVIHGAELAPVLHWHRGDVYIFNVWER